jgi:ABC-type thiamine transport system ATPase subunit
VVALVGYTNAGKSTLLNTMTDAGVLAEDKLFATLDPTTRKVGLVVLIVSACFCCMFFSGAAAGGQPGGRVQRHRQLHSEAAAHRI